MKHLSDTEFAQQFADCTLDPKIFTHEGHLRLAWIHITRYGVEQAIRNLRTQIQAFDKIFGDGTKYHETVTVAAAYMVNHFIQRSSASKFDDFIAEYPRLRTHFKDLLAQHYSFDVFSDPWSKTTYLKPDIESF